MNNHVVRGARAVWVYCIVLVTTALGAAASLPTPAQQADRSAGTQPDTTRMPHDPDQVSTPPNDGNPARIAAHDVPLEPDADAPTDSSKIAEATRGVIGSKHDFSAPSGREGDACRACHVPHVLTVKPGEDPLSENLLSFYRMGGQREVLVTDRYTPGPTSLMCLSCHNGSVASSVLGSAHAILAGKREGFDTPEGWDVRDHPIGIAYPQHREGYRPRALVEADGQLPLPEGRVECTSCHDPHDRKGIDAMLVISNRRSALCLACHEK